MKFKALGLTICLIFLTIFPNIKSSFAYFDNSKQQNIIDDICVGKWDVNKQSVSTSELNTFIESANTIVNVNGQNYELSSYFRESLYFYKNQIQYPFTNYSVNEVENSYQSIMQNIQAFADIKNEKNIKLKENNQNYTDIDTKNLPKQGSSYIYYGYILTYDLSNKNNAPITLNIRMYSSSNEDLSNYAFELLLDSSVFSTSKPISYIYQIKEDNIVIDKITSPRLLDVFTSIIDDKSYDINGNKHQTNCPKLSGKWARFKDGNNQSNSGMIVNGSKKMVELSITLLSYNPINNKEISAIPFAISLSNCGKEQTSLTIDYQVYSGI